MNLNSCRGVALAAGVILAGVALAAPQAKAVPILTFGQVGSANTITGTRTGSSTAISATNVAVTITQIDAAGPPTLAAYLDLALTSTGPATTGPFGNIQEEFSGSFSITSGTGGTGTNFLSGALTDVALGKNAAFTLTASTPGPANVTFSSDVIPAGDLGLDRGASLSFANVTPGLTIVDNTISSFSSSVSGTFSANVMMAVPEPSSLQVFGAGLLCLGMIGLWRKKMMG